MKVRVYYIHAIMLCKWHERVISMRNLNHAISHGGMHPLSKAFRKIVFLSWVGMHEVQKICAVTDTMARCTVHFVIIKNLACMQLFEHLFADRSWQIIQKEVG